MRRLRASQLGGEGDRRHDHHGSRWRLYVWATALSQLLLGVVPVGRGRTALVVRVIGVIAEVACGVVWCGRWWARVRKGAEPVLGA